MFVVDGVANVDDVARIRARTSEIFEHGCGCGFMFGCVFDKDDVLKILIETKGCNFFCVFVART